jgi:hypothetical protein
MPSKTKERRIIVTSYVSTTCGACRVVQKRPELAEPHDAPEKWKFSVQNIPKFGHKSYPF